MAIIVHLLCFTKWILFVVFHVFVVSHVFTTKKHVSFILQNVNICVQLILIIRVCSFCLPKFRTSSSLEILISCDVKIKQKLNRISAFRLIFRQSMQGNSGMFQ